MHSKVLLQPPVLQIHEPFQVTFAHKYSRFPDSILNFLELKDKKSLSLLDNLLKYLTTLTLLRRSKCTNIVSEDCDIEVLSLRCLPQYNIGTIPRDDNI